MIHCVFQIPHAIPMTTHAAEQSAQLLADRHAVAIHLAEDVSRLVNPAEGSGDRHERRIGRLQRVVEGALQCCEAARESPFFATAPRLSAIACNRPCNLRPDASNGGRPSSVNALRTAEQ